MECGGGLKLSGLGVDLPLNSSFQYWEVGEAMELDNLK